MEDFIINLLAVLALVLPFFSVWAAISLFRLSRRHKGNTALRERSNTAIILATTSVMGGLIGFERLFNVTLGGHIIQHEFYVTMLSVIIILTSLPNVLWAIGYRVGNGHD